MEFENSTNWPQEPAVGRYQKQVESTSHCHTTLALNQVLCLMLYGPLSFCNISVIQQDTKYLMINFIHNTQ